MRIGLPKGLLFYYYYPLWKTLFEALGMEIVVSQSTSAGLMDKGVKVSVAEICVPIKAYSGHVIDLLNRDVDYIFIPRMMSIDKGQTFCPKFLGLPEMMAFTIPGLKEKLLAPKIMTNHENMTKLKNYRSLWQTLGISKAQFKAALLKANRSWEDFRSYCMKGYTVDEATDLALGLKNESEMVRPTDIDVNIGLVGYVYNIYDQFISMNIIKKMRSMGVGVNTFEMVDDDYIDKKIGSVSKALFWTFTNKLWGAAEHFYQDSNIDGLIHVTAFGCGPDSLLGSILEMDSDKYDKPFMTVRIDEHTGDNHLDTRIEAFVDMLRRRKHRLKEVEGL